MADTAVEKYGLNGLVAEQEECLAKCVKRYGDTCFTVSMYCLATGSDATKVLAMLKHIHACGCVRKPDNDGGQEYYQVMPGIVHPTAR